MCDPVQSVHGVEMDHPLRMDACIYKSLFPCNYVVSVRRGFLFLWVLGMGCIISLWHPLSLPYNYFSHLRLKIIDSDELIKPNQTIYQLWQYFIITAILHKKHGYLKLFKSLV